MKKMIWVSGIRGSYTTVCRNGYPFYNYRLSNRRSYPVLHQSNTTAMTLFSHFLALANTHNRPLHITQALLLLAAFITGIALLATPSIPPSRSTTLILVYAIKSALFLLYQYLTAHVARFSRWASAKANFLLDALDCLLWFTAFIVTCMGGKRCAGGGCAGVGIAAVLALLLW